MSAYIDERPGGGLLSRLYSRTALCLLGVLAIALMVGLLGITVAVFTHAFANPAQVTMQVDRAGSQLSTGADVKLNGIVVGRVSAIIAKPDGSGATLLLAIDRDQLHLIPANVTAQILPKTLFGEKYVALDLPAGPSTQRLASGDVIARDRSRVAIETSTVLNDLEPLLTAVSPADLDNTLTAIATAIQGRGAALGNLLGQTNRYAAQLRPTVTTLLEDARLFATVGNGYADAAGPLLATLSNTTITARTLTAKQRQLADLLGITQDLATTAGDFIADVGGDAVKVVTVSRPVLSLLAKYSPELACTIRGVVKAKSRLEAVFAAGPFLKARLYVSISRGTYKPGIDAPKSLDLSGYGPYCPVTPKNGVGVVPFPPVPSQLNQIRGTAQPLNSLNGLPGVPIDLGIGGSATASTGQVTAPSDLLGLLLGGVLG